VLTLASPQTGFCQPTAFGEINGTVTDASGGVVPKAKVTAVNQGTSVPVEVYTNGSGQYRVFNLLPAEYSVTIVAQGYKTTTLGPFKLSVGQALTQNATLSVGAVTETVNVAAEGQLLETTTVGNSTVVEQK